MTICDRPFIQFANLCLMLATATAPRIAAADEAIPADPPLVWWKGNIHTHSLWSSGDDFPEMIAEWYRTHDYNFLALSDHNVLSEGNRWMKRATIVKRGGSDVVEKYQRRFGGGWVETRGEPNGPDDASRHRAAGGGELHNRIHRHTQRF